MLLRAMLDDASASRTCDTMIARLRLAEEQCAAQRDARAALVDVDARADRVARSAMQHSASATASPPSLQSCAERTAPARIALEQRVDRARSRASRSQRGGAPATTPCIAREVLAAAQLVGRLAEQHDVVALAS